MPVSMFVFGDVEVEVDGLDPAFEDVGPASFHVRCRHHAGRQVESTALFLAPHPSYYHSRSRKLPLAELAK
jgi:hypothetical protein